LRILFNDLSDLLLMYISHGLLFNADQKRMGGGEHFEKLGLTVNWAKSLLVPSQKIIFLGTEQSL